MNLRERTLAYMKSRHLSRQQMAELIDVRCHSLAKYLDSLPGCSKEVDFDTLNWPTVML